MAEFTAKAKAFTGEGVKEHRFMVEDGTIRVFDSVADHFTTVHSLSKAAERRLLKIAENKELYDNNGNPRANGPRCTTCGDLIAWGSHPQCDRKRGKLIRQ